MNNCSKPNKVNLTCNNGCLSIKDCNKEKIINWQTANLSFTDPMVWINDGGNPIAINWEDVRMDGVKAASFEALRAYILACKEVQYLGVDPVDPVEVPLKTYIEKCFVKNPNNQKEVIPVFVAVNNETGLPCYFLDPELTNQININDYEMIETNLGQLIVDSPLVANEIPYEADGIVLCLDATDQDIVALIKGTTLYTDFVAAVTAKYPLPAGAAYGLSKISVEQFSGTPKRNVYCDVADAVQAVDQNTQVTTVGLGNTSLLTVGGRKPYGRALKPIEVVDTDGSCKVCNDVACELVDGDIIVNGGVGNAVQIDFCIACFATPA